MISAFVFHYCSFRKRPIWNKRHFEPNRIKSSFLTRNVAFRERAIRALYLSAQLDEELSESINSDIVTQETRAYNSSQYTIRAPEWFIKLRNERKKDYELKPGEIAVRFINTPTGEDIVVAAKPSENLMDVADSVGLKIPRYCETGVCGTCTAELEDLSSVDGRVAIRPCCTDVHLPTGCDEMVVDVFHCRNFSSVVDYTEEVLQSDRKLTRDCTTCLGQGIVSCFPCGGSGLLSDSDAEELCCYCMGRKITLCPDCQGKGLTKVQW
ncbi:hypothetical protein Gasu2_39140 [Galdieria sulphuraria]|uniref:2Fe-2S ferredoxin-type domain-containing protein n=1 Tax=Galdieria sulphuraria TaxID=130081 RepID=M2XPV2_GALSU|nr:uncharacterized protein Gasu_06560 [Galdieria sulphuraria]EME32247.1 hypothetical protein Gasu_06560 [Galdieria sulphuraria]GJD09674.1 hypothetical protein Gasu2_39140 [Galdieria sulphuraria]|eukprot:XP_005708767.1 hypothetical protein Gasu_06560 [Galdieria sulphuraria]